MRNHDAEVHIVIYSYKNQHLHDVVQSIYDTVDIGLFYVTVIDQHPLDRENKFSNFRNLDYVHQFWDKIESPCNIKAGHIASEEHAYKYAMLLGDSCILENGWYETAKQFLKEHPDAILSGKGKRKIGYKDKHFFNYLETDSDGIVLSNLVDTSFIIGETKTLRKVEYPSDVKYYGEAEKLSMLFWEKEVPIFSMPSNAYFDSGERTLEMLYTPFSIEHNYNSIFEMLNNPKYSGWGEYHSINRDLIKKIPYQIDDVLYDPYNLSMTTVGQDRFIATTKAIL